jgi:hypothetical protein
MTDKELTDILHEKRNELAKVEVSLTDLKAHKAYLTGQIKTFEKELKRREKWAESIKYSLTEGFEYASGQDSPITGLPPGTYTVYAKDAAGCTDEVIVD